MPCCLSNVRAPICTRSDIRLVMRAITCARPKAKFFQSHRNSSYAHWITSGSYPYGYGSHWRHWHCLAKRETPTDRAHVTSSPQPERGDLAGLGRLQKRGPQLNVISGIKCRSLGGDHRKEKDFSECECSTNTVYE